MRKKWKAKEEKRRKRRRRTVKEKKAKDRATNEGKCGLTSLFQLIVEPDSSAIFPREKYGIQSRKQNEKGVLSGWNDSMKTPRIK